MLGGRPKDKTVLNYTNKIDQQKIEKRPWYQDAISALIELSKSSKIAIMCSEENPERCHRGYILSHTLLDRGEEIIHIRGDGSPQKAQYFEKQLSFTFGDDESP